MPIRRKIGQPSFPSVPLSLIQKLFNSDNSLPHSTTSSVASRDRLVVRTLRCGRSNPGSNPGSGMFLLFCFSLSLHCLLVSFDLLLFLFFLFVILFVCYRRRIGLTSRAPVENDDSS